MTAAVRIVPIDASNWRAALAVTIPDEQLRFVADHQPVALVVLSKAFMRPGGLAVSPLAFLVDGDVVGLVGVVEAATYLELIHFVIDGGMQGRGLGTEALSALAEYLSSTRGLGCELRLTVHPDNLRAQRLYRRAGFEATGEIRHDEPVWSRPAPMS